MQSCPVSPAVKVIDSCAARARPVEDIPLDAEQANGTVVIISGDLNNEGHVARALRSAGIERQRNANVIVVLMMRATQAAVENRDAALQMRSHLADCLFIVSAQEYDFVLERFIRSIVSPFARHAHLCCDWNDLRSMFAYGQGGLRNGFGFGRATGEDKDRKAVTLALQNLSERNGDITQSAGVLIVMVARPSSLKGRDIKNIMSMLRAHLQPSTSVVQSIAYDEALMAEEIQVDIFTIRAVPAGTAAPEVLRTGLVR